MSKNFLLTGFYFDGYNGSVMHICEIGEYLAANGWTVGIVSVDISPDIRDFVLSKGIALYSADALPKDIVWQYALCYHFPMLAYLVRNGVTIEKAAVGSLSGLELMESPSFLAKDASLPVFVHCGSLKQKLIRNHGVDENAIFIVPNLVPDRFKEYAKEQPPTLLNSVAIISNHMPDEMVGAAARLRQKSITVDLFGVKHTYIPVTPELLSKYDCIVTIGKTVQYGLALGIPVFNYDRFGGEGYIRLSNMDEEEYYNYSGRRTFRKLSADELAAELTDGFTAAAEETPLLRVAAQDRYIASNQIHRILSILNRWNYQEIQETTDNRMYFDYCCCMVTETLEHLKYYRQAYYTISNAFFWKITKPLRVAADWLKHLKNNFSA